MKKREYHLGFQLSMIMWVLVYLSIYVCIFYQIYAQFYPLLEEYKMKQTVKEYLIRMLLIMLITIALSVMWWFLARTEKIPLLREKFDYYTLVFVVIEIAILFVAIFFLNPPGYGLVDDLDNLYELDYGYSFLYGFCMNMFCFPPSNVELVMLGGRKPRFCVAAAAFVAGIINLFS